MQEVRLWIADPKAINHILQKSGYLYAKPSHIRERSALLADRGITWAGGESPIAISPFLLLARGRRCTQASQEGDGHSVRRRRDQSFVAVFHGFCYKGARTSFSFDLGCWLGPLQLDGGQVE